jgi:LysM repeat protein
MYKCCRPYKMCHYHEHHHYHHCVPEEMEEDYGWDKWDCEKDRDMERERERHRDNYQDRAWDPAPPPCPDGKLYTIRRGDTLYAISRRTGVSVEQIIAANPGIDPNNLQIGRIICIPMRQPMPCPGFIYRIQAGDTLYSLARRYNTTVAEIMAYNPGIDPNNLQIGAAICIPRKPEGCPAGTQPYRIVKGDTLYRLAQRFNTSVQAILDANPGIDPNNLQIGQIICIPR